MMLTVFITLLLVLVILALWRKFHIEYHTLQFRFKLFELRDKLRMLCIEGKIDSNNWAFKYLDESISVAVREAYFITLPSVVIYGLMHENNKKLKEFRERLSIEIEKSDELVRIEKEYVKAASHYIFEQNYVFLISAEVVLKFFKGFTTAARRFENLVSKITILPETSASVRGNYAV